MKGSKGLEREKELKGKIQKIREIMEKKNALQHAEMILNWDLETEAPALSVERISKTLGYLSGEIYSLVINEEFKELVYSIDVSQLDNVNRKIVEEIRKEFFDKMEKIPKEEYKKYSELRILSVKKWEEAKNKNDYSLFKDYLSEVIEFQKKFIKYRGYTGHPYNTLLDDYEEGMTVESADKFFEKVRTDLSPFIKKVIHKEKLKNHMEKEEIFRKMVFEKEKQKELSKYLLEVLKFDMKKGILKESEHPFTTNVNNKDVRLTTHYYEDNLLSGVYSTIHEAGHGLYEQNIDDEITDTILGEGTSMGIHESQSRIYENMFGRSRGFLEFLYTEIDKLFGISGKGITEEDLYRLVNKVENSFIRTESDELTYSIHILIRYELEKEIFENLDEKTDVDALVEKWNDKYEEYLGIRPGNFREGILQDVHWSSGLFGYFPSYALGSAYAAQIYNVINKKINVNDELRKGEFKNINEVLRNEIHKYGKLKSPSELIEDMTGEIFNPEYYIKYLIGKFSDVYNLE